MVRYYEKIEGDENRYTHVILKHSVSRWDLLRPHLTKYKVVLLESTLALLNPSHIQEFKIISYEKYIRGNSQCTSMVQMMSRKILSQE